MVGGDTNHGGKDSSIMWQVETPATPTHPIGVKCRRHEIYLKCRRHVIPIALIIASKTNAVGVACLLNGCNAPNPATLSDGWWGHQPWRQV